MLFKKKIFELHENYFFSTKKIVTIGDVSKNDLFQYKYTFLRNELQNFTLFRHDFSQETTYAVSSTGDLGVKIAYEDCRELCTLYSSAQ